MRTPKYHRGQKGRIARFCSKPRTLKEIKERFGISGITAGAYMGWLCRCTACSYNNNKEKTYVRDGTNRLPKLWSKPLILKLRKRPSF